MKEIAACAVMRGKTVRKLVKLAVMPVCVSLLVDLTVSSAWAGQKNRGYITVQESCCQTMESRTKQKIRYETAENRAEQKIRYETAESRADQKMRHHTAENLAEQKNPAGSPSLQILAPVAVLMRLLQDRSFTKRMRMSGEVRPALPRL